MKKSRLSAIMILCAAMLLILLLPTAASAEPGYNGGKFINADITSDTTIGPGVYYVCVRKDKQAPAIRPGVTLTIESGSTVYFSSAIVSVNDGKDLLSGSIDVNGTLNADGVTFKAMTGHEANGWNGIQARVTEEGKPANVNLKNCTFQNAAFPVEAKENNSLSDGQTVNVSATNCVFKDPHKPEKNHAAIYYNNGIQKAGAGSINLSACTVTGYPFGLWVGGNSRDPISISVENCTFNSIVKQPLMIESGQSAKVKDCVFNDIKAGMQAVVTIFNTQNEPSEAAQTVTVAGNTFNGDATTNKYPVVIGAQCRINSDCTSDSTAFSANYPEAYRYIQLTGSIGNGVIGQVRVEHAVWGFSGVPYLVNGNKKVAGNADSSDNIYSSLTIKPGVIAYFEQGAGLTIDGALTAEGTEAAGIKFRFKPNTADFSFGINVRASLEGPISLKYCDIAGLTNGVDIKEPSTAGLAPDITIENCSIASAAYTTNLIGKNVVVRNTSFTGPGVDIGSGQNVSLTNCSITSSAQDYPAVFINQGNTITLDSCDIRASASNGNKGGVNISASKSVKLKNCLVAGFPNYGVRVYNNTYPTVEAGGTLLENCTIAGNGSAGLHVDSDNNYGVNYYSPFVRNSIIAENASTMSEPKLDIVKYNDRDIIFADGSLAYSLISRDEAPYNQVNDYYKHPDFYYGIYKISSGAFANRIIGDPLFAGKGDYHLKSEAGRCKDGGWVLDAETSPCIDAGDPTSLYGKEPAPNGSRINLGRYGNTVQASKTPGSQSPGTQPSNPPASSAGGGGSTPPAPASEVGSGESISGDDIERLISQGESLTVEGANGAKLIFDKESLESINEQAAEKITLDVTDVSDEYKEAHPGRPVFSLSVKSGDKTISNFGGSVTVFLPYQLRDGEEAKDVSTWHLSVGGALIEVPCSYDPVTGLVKFKLSHFSLYMVGITSTWENSFTDVRESDWFYNSVKFVNESKLMHGSDKTRFNPKAKTSRAMIVSILYRLGGTPGTGAGRTFTDVPAGRWYSDAVAWALENRIVSGYGNGKFGPNDAITREQMAAILMNYAKFKGYNLSKNADLTTFTDEGDISLWAKDAMSWANAEGLIQGSGTKLMPGGNAERAQVAAILRRFIENIVK